MKKCISQLKNSSYLLIIILLTACGNDVDSDRDSETKEHLQKEIDQLRVENDSLHKATEVWEQSNPVNFSEAFDSIEQPEEYIVNALQEQPGLIPEDAELGGQMHFSSIEILNDRLILAEYEDGHIMGTAIYGYNIDESGNLNFNLITTLEE